MVIDDVAPAGRLLARGAWRCSRPALPRVELDPIDPSSPGRSDYSGPLLSDLDFAEFSHSALVRIADEVCLQMHLLFLGFRRAVFARLPADEALEICVKQLTGIAGVAASRLADRALAARVRRGRRAGARPAPAVQPGRLRLDRGLPRPSRRGLDLARRARRRSDRSRRSSRPSTHTSTWRSPAPRGRSRSSPRRARPTSPARWRSPGSAPAPPSPSSRGGRCRSRPSEWLLLVREDAAHPVWTSNSDGETPIIGVLRPRDRRGCDCPPGAPDPDALRCADRDLTGEHGSEVGGTTSVTPGHPRR